MAYENTHVVWGDVCLSSLSKLAARGLEEPRNSQELLTESVDLTKFVGPLPFSV